MKIYHFEKISQNLVLRQHAYANDPGKMFKMESVLLIILPFYKLENFQLVTKLCVKKKTGHFFWAVSVPLLLHH